MPSPPFLKSLATVLFRNAIGLFDPDNLYTNFFTGELTYSAPGPYPDMTRMLLYACVLTV